MSCVCRCKVCRPVPFATHSRLGAHAWRHLYRVPDLLACELLRSLASASPARNARFGLPPTRETFFFSCRVRHPGGFQVAPFLGGVPSWDFAWGLPTKP